MHLIGQRADHRVVLEFFQIRLAELIKILRGELRPAGEGVAADARRAQRLFLHRTPSFGLPRFSYNFASRRPCSSSAASNNSTARSFPTTAAALKTFGGWPACVSRDATSALIAFTTRHPPTVEPGLTGVSSPSTRTIASPTGAPVSSTRSAKSWSRFPRKALLSLASE